MNLGWAFVSGDWVNARAVEMVRASQVEIAGSRTVAALIDGEPRMIASDTIISATISAPIFLATRPTDFSAWK